MRLTHEEGPDVTWFMACLMAGGVMGRPIGRMGGEGSEAPEPNWTYTLLDG